MKMIRDKNTVVESRDFPGLIECSLTHEIKETKGALTYVGPKIPPLVWHQVLSFFKWTYDTTKSESQVRLYVNTRTNEWAAWAYPQEARTGMTAKELDTADAKEQRKQFPDSEGWIYFGTVHHHCSCGAFQSGTDHSNEKDQDGLHITVGGMDGGHYSLHSRFYLSGFEFKPDLSLFWDIGEVLTGMTPDGVHRLIAEHQMGIPSSAEFPAKWRENLIEIKSVSTFQGDNWTKDDHGNWRFKGDKVGGIGYGSSYGYTGRVSKFSNLGERKKEALKEAVEAAAAMVMEESELRARLEEMSLDGFISAILDACEEYDLDVRDILDALDEAMMEAAKGATQIGGPQAEHTHCSRCNLPLVEEESIKSGLCRPCRATSTPIGAGGGSSPNVGNGDLTEAEKAAWGVD